MRGSIKRFKAGEIVEAKVVELINANEAIVSFSGDLLRVKDETMRLTAAQGVVQLVVVRVNLLTFKLAQNHKNGHVSIVV
ncbi:MAG: hypothetical protein R2827_09490 [Bdellovibrionales bacterium]